jgi:hypothetical protein
MSSHLQLLLIALGGVAIFLLLRTLLSPGARDDFFSYDRTRSASDRFTHAFGTQSANTNSAAPIAENLGRVRVTQFNFSHFDVVPGPPDPENFADELIIELYDSVSDFRWTVTYVVATPAGIRKLMDDEQWKFFYATEIFVVRRYDLQIIREAVFGRINEIHEKVSLDPEQPPYMG